MPESTKAPQLSIVDRLAVHPWFKLAEVIAGGFGVAMGAKLVTTPDYEYMGSVFAEADEQLLSGGLLTIAGVMLIHLGLSGLKNR